MKKALILEILIRKIVKIIFVTFYQTTIKNGFSSFYTLFKMYEYYSQCKYCNFYI